MSELSEKRPVKLLSYPNATRLVNRLLEDVLTVFDEVPGAKLKALEDRFHTSARWHRHEIERFWKKQKRTKSRIGMKAE